MHFTLDPAQIITGWTALIAVLSLVNKFGLGKLSPNVARFVSAIISLPTGHLANFIEDIQQLVADLRMGPTPTAAGGTGSPSNFKPPSKPPAPTTLRGPIGFGALVAGCLFIIPANACTPAQQATFAKVEQIVLDDIMAGKTKQQTEQDVAAAFAGQPGVDVVIVLNDVLVFLIDAGFVPANWLPHAQQMLAKVAPEAIAHRAALKVGP